MRKPQVGTILKADGTSVDVTPKDGKKFTLSELQSFVGGYIETIALLSGNGHVTAYANEEGKLNGLPHNCKATLISVVGQYGDYIAGDMVIIGTKPYRAIFRQEIV